LGSLVARPVGNEAFPETKPGDTVVRHFGNPLVSGMGSLHAVPIT
jgi:hypothetical protein